MRGTDAPSPLVLLHRASENKAPSQRPLRCCSQMAGDFVGVPRCGARSVFVLGSGVDKFDEAHECLGYLLHCHDGGQQRLLRLG